jgi:hypothetical protein
MSRGNLVDVYAFPGLKIETWGTRQKNLKTMHYMGAVGLLILATFISSRKKTPTSSQWEIPWQKIQNRCTHLQ